MNKHHNGVMSVWSDYSCDVLVYVPSFLLPVKVKENELLPVLLDELPHLLISPQALGQMWEQQMQQVDRLHAMSSSNTQRRNKLSCQVGQWLLQD